MSFVPSAELFYKVKSTLISYSVIRIFFIGSGIGLAKIEELETNSKINNIMDLYRGISDMEKRYQPRTRIVKDEKGDLVADSHSIMAR